MTATKKNNNSYVHQRRKAYQVLVPYQAALSIRQEAKGQIHISHSVRTSLGTIGETFVMICALTIQL